jgi:hypothetical protein
MPMFILIFVILFGINIYASCGSADCPLYHFHYNLQGGLHLRLYNEYINQDEIYVGSTKSFAGAIPEHHDEVSTLNSITAFQFQYGLTDRLDIGILLPYVHREHNHIHHHEDGDEWENWNFSGLGDISIIANYSVILPERKKEFYFGITAGLKMPTGITNAVNFEGEQAEVTIQPGTGSWDGLLGLNFRYPLFIIKTAKENEYSTIPLIIGISYKIPGKGTFDYQFGKTLIVSGGTDYQLSSKASVVLQINLRNQNYANTGSTDEPRENTGGTWIYLSPGMNLNLNDIFSVFGFIQLPVYQNVHGIQQASKFNLQLGISANTNLL